MGHLERRSPGRLSELIRRLRTRAGLTQQELAKVSGVSVASLRDLEQGRVRKPRVATLLSLAEALRLSDSEAEQLTQQTGSSVDGLRIELLGPLNVRVDGATVDVGSVTQRTLLGLLALSPNAPISWVTLVEALWGGDAPPKAVELLQSHVSRLRRRLVPATDPSGPPNRLVATTGGYQLRLRGDELDVLVLRRLVRQARQARGSDDLHVACKLYAEAADLWRGEPLAELPGVQSHPVIASLTREWQTLVLEYAEVAAALGRSDEVLLLLEKVALADPLHEPAHAQLMLSLAASGQQAAAFAVFDGVRRRLTDDLGAVPGPELMAAHRRVLRQEVSRPAIGTVSAHRQLPGDIADFTGRTVELAALHDCVKPLTNGDPAPPRICAIQGMAGVGKTRLAIHFAHELLTARRFADAQLYVDLRGHSDEPPADPATVLASFLQLLGVPGHEIPDDLESRAKFYRERLHHSSALVLLDNAATEDQVSPLLPAGPDNLVLVTSRRRLALNDSHVLSLDVLPPGEAVALVARIIGCDRFDADPDGAHRLVDLCGRLPLAVALASRRLRARPTWTFGDMASRLDEVGTALDELAVGSRQILPVFDLSYRGLCAAARRVFRLLGMHPGDDCAPASVAAMAGLDVTTTEALLHQLVDEHLLIRTAGGRFRLHDLYAGTPATSLRSRRTRKRVKLLSIESWTTTCMRRI